MKSNPETGNKLGQQPPISRPVGPQQAIGSPLPFTPEQLQPMQNPSPLLLQGLLDQQQGLYGNQQLEASARARYGGPAANMNPTYPSSCQLSSLLSGASIAELATSTGLNPYEKWSNGSDSLFGGLHSQQSNNQHEPHAFKERLNMRNHSHSSNDGMMDLTTKMLSQTALSSPPMPPSTPQMQHSSSSSQSALYPPKSQIKRQKMIYHCKFGEFGILEGQFTEPSGVAVNAQNDIIVADTNNHRIQIFDKEGRFKFQFGEVGKRDGQLLYPNRVAVVKTSGDIIVTER